MQFRVYVDSTTRQAMVHKESCFYANMARMGPYESVGDALVAGIEQEGLDAAWVCRRCFSSMRVVQLPLRPD